MITFAKMRLILTLLEDVHGMVETSNGGEIALAPTGQLSKAEHDWLVKRGFVYVNQTYIYRPIIRKRKS